MNTSNLECKALTRDDVDRYITEWQAEQNYWSLSRNERKKIDAQRHKQGLPKYKMI